MRAVLAALVMTTLAACGGSGGECRVDDDCGGEVCTRVHVCAPASDVYALRVEWTVRGLTTDQPGACTGITALELGVTDPATGEDYRVSPVPCGVGSFVYDKLPRSYSDVDLSAYDGSRLLDSQRGTPDDTGLIRFALLAR